MTLVIGHASDEIGFLIADTLISSKVLLKGEEGEINGVKHVLKIHILSGTVAIAFAGDPEPACELINEINSKLKVDDTFCIANELLLLYKLKVAAARNHCPVNCEFLILRLTRTGKKLEKVDLQNGVQEIVRGYIGDSSAYRKLLEKFPQYRQPVLQHTELPGGGFSTGPFIPSSSEAEFSSLSDALEELCHRASVETVGAVSDAITRVVDARISRELEYMQAIYASNSPEEGKSGYSLLATNSAPRGMAIFFFAGCVGFVFFAGDVEGSKRLKADTIHELITRAKSIYGLELSGATIP